MKLKVTKNDVPSVETVKEALLAVLESGRARAFSGTAGAVAKRLELTRAQRSYRIAGSKNTLFENRLVQARAELTKEGAITYRSGKVKLAKVAEAAIRKECVVSDVDALDAASIMDKPVAAAGFAVHPGAPNGRPTKCLSFQQPYASFIATGVKTAEFRSKKVSLPLRDLVVCASKTPRIFPDKLAGMVYGMAIGVVDVVDCVGISGDYVWKLENARLIKPFPVHATAGFFYVADVPEVIPNTEQAYREWVLPQSFRGVQDDEDFNIASLFSPVADGAQKAYEVDGDKFELVVKEWPYCAKG